MLLEASTQPLKLLAKSTPVAYRRPVEVLSAFPQFTEWMKRPNYPRVKGKKLEGLKFEKRVRNALSSQFETFCPSLPFRYTTPRMTSFCIPDGWILTDSAVVCIEIKLRHTTSAWFQMNNLYLPVLRRAFNLPVRTLEVVRWFDPEIRFPVPTRLYTSVRSFLEVDSETGVCVWGLV